MRVSAVLSSSDGAITAGMLPRLYILSKALRQLYLYDTLTGGEALRDAPERNNARRVLPRE